jgi:two-component system sensor kinase FixL
MSGSTGPRRRRLSVYLGEIVTRVIVRPDPAFWAWRRWRNLHKDIAAGRSLQDGIARLKAWTMMDQTSIGQDMAKSAADLLADSAYPEAMLSTDFTILSCSDSYLRILGASRDSAVGHPLREVMAGGPDLERLMGSLALVLSTRRPDRVALDLLSGASERTSTPKSWLAVNMPVLAEDGSVKWVLHTLDPRSDERLPMAKALEAAEARLRSIMRTVPDAMLIIDERGLIESLSTTAERLFGYTIEEIAGRNVSVLMPSPYREQHDTYLKRYLSTGERRIIGIGRIVVGQRKDGTTFPIHLTVGELRSADKHYFTGFIRDLTDQQLTESRLKELQSEVTHMSRYTALGEMASTLAHEINQPLTAISNYLKGSQRLLDRLDDKSAPVLRDALGKAAEQAIRAGHIIRRLREFVARGESDRRIESLPRLIEDASTLALMGTRENGIAVSFRLDPRADLVLADRIQIQQVLVNLIRNAIEVMSDSPREPGLERRLEIATVADDNGHAEVSVGDTGSGLAPEVAAHLFQPFVTTKRKGMGLGLSICRTIVEAHGGRIWVENRPGGGTIFRFTLRSPEEEDVPAS